MEHSYVWIVWDFIAVLIFFLLISSCARRGFVSSLMNFAGYFVASAVAAIGNSTLARFLYDRIVRDALLHMLTRRLNQAFSGSGASNAGILDAIPGILQRIMGSSSAQVAALSPGDAAENIAGTIIDIALHDPVMTILKTVSFLLLFTLAAFFVRFLARLFTGIQRIPLIGTLNTVLGGILGVFGGGVTLYIAAFFLRLLTVFSGDKWWWLNDSVMDSTYIWRVFL